MAIEITSERRGCGTPWLRPAPASPEHERQRCAFVPNGQAKCARGQATPAGRVPNNTAIRSASGASKSSDWAVTRAPRASARTMACECGGSGSFEKLAHRGDAMLRRGGEDRLAERDRLEVVAAADFRLGAVLDRDEQLCHRADEGVGEPDFVPARLRSSSPGCCGVRVVERARRRARGTSASRWCPRARPSVPSIRQRMPMSPADALLARPGPDIVPRVARAAGVVFEDVEVDAVACAGTSCAGRAACWRGRGRACRTSSGTCRGGGCS